jgi:diacylglycerol kinase
MINIKRLKKSFQYAIRGLKKVIREEQNFRVQMLLAFITVSLAYYLEVSRIEWIFLVSVIILVFLMEVVNSAVERVADVLKPRINTYVKEIKDIMAGAVLLASFLAITVGIIIFYPYFFP